MSFFLSLVLGESTLEQKRNSNLCLMEMYTSECVLILSKSHYTNVIIMIQNIVWIFTF